MALISGVKHNRGGGSNARHVNKKQYVNKYDGLLYHIAIDKVFDYWFLQIQSLSPYMVASLRCSSLPNDCFRHVHFGF